MSVHPPRERGKVGKALRPWSTEVARTHGQCERGLLPSQGAHHCLGGLRQEPGLRDWMICTLKAPIFGWENRGKSWLTIFFGTMGGRYFETNPEKPMRNHEPCCHRGSNLPPKIWEAAGWSSWASLATESWQLPAASTVGHWISGYVQSSRSRKKMIH